MAALINAIQTVLTGTSAWTTQMTGGTKIPDDLGKNGLHPDDLTVDANGVMRPTAMLMWSSGTAAELAQRSYRHFLYVRLFADPTNGWATIRAAQRLLRLPVGDGGVLHRRQVQSDTEGHALVCYVNDGPDFYDEALNGAAATFVRLYAEFRQR